jgi:hypothetical protein
MELTIDNSLRPSFDSNLAVTIDVLIHLTHGGGAVDSCLCPKLKIITLSPMMQYLPTWCCHGGLMGL